MLRICWAVAPLVAAIALDDGGDAQCHGPVCSASSEDQSLLQTKGRDAERKGLRPNILFLLVDDMGYGDVDICPDSMDFEHCMQRPMSEERAQHLKTPRLKQMASEGLIFNNFYSPRAICTPSRAGLMTGRDASRYKFTSPLVRILVNSAVRGGVPQSEITTAEYLKDLGYTTGYAGKWHMGLGTGIDPFHYCPWNQGFDEVEFFIEGSNSEPCKRGAQQYADDRNIYSGCTFSHVMNSSGVVLEQPIRWENITARQQLTTMQFIERHANDTKPWYFQHSYTSVHIPWVPSRFWVTDVERKPFTDFIHDIDWSVGVFLDQLTKLNIDKKTLVILASDNGAYLESASTWCPQNCKRLTPLAQIDGFSSHYGCEICDKPIVSLNTPLAGGKGNTYEGGMRTPGIWWWPGTIQAGGVTSVVASQLDFLPTAVSLAGGKLRKGVAYDGRDISDVILETPDPGAAPVGEFFYWCGDAIMAVRKDAHKIVWRSQMFLNEDWEPTDSAHCGGEGQCCSGIATRLCLCQAAVIHDPPLVIDLTTNVGEDPKYALDPDSPDTKQIVEVAEAMRLAKARSVADDNGVSWKEGDTAESVLIAVAREPNLMGVDYCLTSGDQSLGDWGPPPNFSLAPFLFGAGQMATCGASPFEENVTLTCPLVKPECQIERFSPYDGCDMNQNMTFDQPECASRRPCGVQEGYNGPFEAINPGPNNETTPCGAFRQPTVNSHFPASLLQSVCDWQDEYLKLVPSAKFCRPPQCVVEEEEANQTNAELCYKIAQGISISPTGYLWNAPYPEDQEAPMLWDGPLPRTPESEAHWYGYPGGWTTTTTTTIMR
jgi:arylsulfatase A-like enzyme